MARKMLVDGEVAAVADAGQYDYDLFVIGAGSGGVRGSRFAASFGAKVRWFSPSFLPCRFYTHCLMPPRRDIRAHPLPPARGSAASIPHAGLTGCHFHGRRLARVACCCPGNIGLDHFDGCRLSLTDDPTLRLAGRLND